MEGLDRFIMRELDDAEVGLGEDREEAVADVGNNADLYVANQDQESTDLINETHMEHGGHSFAFHGSRRILPTFSSRLVFLSSACR